MATVAFLEGLVALIDGINLWCMSNAPSLERPEQQAKVCETLTVPAK